MILITVMLLISLLMAAGMGAVVSVQNDLRTTANLRTGTAASYLADAGIEWGKQRIATARTMPPTLSNTVQSLPQGSYSVSFLSSTQSTPLSATVMLRSLGNANNAVQAVHARVVKTYDLADAAIVLRGNARSINFAGRILFNLWARSRFEHRHTSLRFPTPCRHHCRGYRSADPAGRRVRHGSKAEYRR